jgi:hypothetical protein
MPFDMSLKDWVVIPQAHFPVVHNVVIDSINFTFIWMHIQIFNVSVHQDWIFFHGLVFDMTFLLLPIILIFFVFLDDSCLLCIFNQLLLMQTIKHCSSVYCGVEAIFG